MGGGSRGGDAARGAYPGRAVPRVERVLRRVLSLSATEARATIASRRLGLACGYVCEAVPDRDGYMVHALTRRRLAAAR